MQKSFPVCTVDVVPWPAFSFSCVVFYDDWSVDFVVGLRDCATLRTITVFDVEVMLPQHHVQVLYPALLILLYPALILGTVLFLYSSKLSQIVCLSVLLRLFLTILCCSRHCFSNNETQSL